MLKGSLTIAAANGDAAIPYFDEVTSKVTQVHVPEARFSSIHAGRYEALPFIAKASRNAVSSTLGSMPARLK